MPPQLENTDDIWDWNTEMLWNLYNYLATTEGFKNTKQYQTVKYGWRIPKEIYWLITPGWYEEYPHAGQAIIQNLGKVSITDLRDEIEYRNTIMRQKILELCQTKESIEPR